MSGTAWSKGVILEIRRDEGAKNYGDSIQAREYQLHRFSRVFVYEMKLEDDLQPFVYAKTSSRLKPFFSERTYIYNQRHPDEEKLIPEHSTSISFLIILKWQALFGTILEYCQFSISVWCQPHEPPVDLLSLIQAAQAARSK
jgi:hypothetical protein